MEHASPAVNVENARVYLGGHEILHNISWQVQRGERCFILGANGAGKTTLVKVLMGFAWPLFGARVQVLGKTFGHVNLLELRKSIAWVSPFMHKWLEDGSWNGRDMVLSGPDGTIGLLRESTPEEEEKAAGIMKSIEELAETRPDLTIVFITQRIEDILPVFNRGMILKSGEIVAHGSRDEVLTEANLKDAFGLDIQLIKTEKGRLWTVIR